VGTRRQMQRNDGKSGVKTITNITLESFTLSYHKFSSMTATKSFADKIARDSGSPRRVCATAPEDDGSKNVAASALRHLRVVKALIDIAKSHGLFSEKLLLLLNHKDFGEGLLLRDFLFQNRHKVDERGLLHLVASHFGGVKQRLLKLLKYRNHCRKAALSLSLPRSPCSSHFPRSLFVSLFLSLSSSL